MSNLDKLLNLLRRYIESGCVLYTDDLREALEKVEADRGNNNEN